MQEMANAIRGLTIDAIEKSKSGHPGMPLGMADVATVLFSKFIKFNPNDAKWPNRDRFVLSAGHGSMLQYALHYLTGMGENEITLDEIKNFRSLNAKTAGHPEYGHAKGIETTTGPLGQGITNAVGLALGERIFNNKFGNELINHKTYVIAGDGCLMEGISQEAISLAGHLRLSNLIVLWDNNNISIDGTVDISSSDNQKMRFEASNWKVLSCNGHNFEDIEKALTEANNSKKPVLIDCKTIIGKGSPNKENSSSVHGAPLGCEEAQITKKNINWDYEPFHVPENILEKWRDIGKKNIENYNNWKSSLKNNNKNKEFHDFIKKDIINDLNKEILNLKKEAVQNKNNLASRQSSFKVLEAIKSKIPQLVGGSADLTGSNLTKTTDSKVITSNNYDGNYIYYGIREHGMAAVMNGLSLYGGIIPYGATFLIFTDYCRPAIRLSALMNQPCIYVMTHDSIGLGEDGPTHQPVEHLASLRAIPNLNVFRPADLCETAECWQLALENKLTPSILALSRQSIPHITKNFNSENKCAKGLYLVKGNLDKRKVTIIASGSEISIALDVHKKLKEKNISCAIISAPSLELFNEQSNEYKNSILGNAPKIVIEAGIEQSWHNILDKNDSFVGMSSFGASAPINDLYENFGITSKKVLSIIKEKYKLNI